MGDATRPGSRAAQRTYHSDPSSPRGRNSNHLEARNGLRPGICRSKPLGKRWRLNKCRELVENDTSGGGTQVDAFPPRTATSDQFPFGVTTDLGSMTESPSIIPSSDADGVGVGRSVPEPQCVQDPPSPFPLAAQNRSCHRCPALGMSGSHPPPHGGQHRGSAVSRETLPSPLQRSNPRSSTARQTY